MLHQCQFWPSRHAHVNGRSGHRGDSVRFYCKTVKVLGGSTLLGDTGSLLWDAELAPTAAFSVVDALCLRCCNLGTWQDSSEGSVHGLAGALATLTKDYDTVMRVGNEPPLHDTWCAGWRSSGPKGLSHYLCYRRVSLKPCFALADACLLLTSGG